MRRILVANLKGGCGKTTLATTLASALAARGDLVGLVDADRQKSALRWLKARSEALPLIAAADWTKGIEAEPKGLSHLVIDAPGGLKGDKAEDLVEIADMVVVPVLPSVFDTHSTGKFLERIEDLKAIRKGRTTIALVVNRARPRTKALNEVEVALGELGRPASATITDRGLYAELAREGRGLFDVKGKAFEPMKAQWQPLLAMIDAL
ncbi:MAG: AAA family ATPase [Hyphomicrobiaceae bacterium]|nr:AAA family ATPase [Hyphomicrobiaceae bacterium]